VPDAAVHLNYTQNSPTVPSLEVLPHPGIEGGGECGLAPRIQLGDRSPTELVRTTDSHAAASVLSRASLHGEKLIGSAPGSIPPEPSAGAKTALPGRPAVHIETGHGNRDGGASNAREIDSPQHVVQL